MLASCDRYGYASASHGARGSGWLCSAGGAEARGEAAGTSVGGGRRQGAAKGRRRRVKESGRRSRVVPLEEAPPRAVARQKRSAALQKILTSSQALSGPRTTPCPLLGYTVHIHA